jgi:hypothetical protein
VETSLYIAINRFMKYFFLFFLFFNSFSFFGQKKTKPNLYIVIEDRLESNKELRSELDQLIKVKTLKKYSTKFYFLGNRILQPEYPDNIDFKTFVLSDLCSVCDRISSWNILDEFSFQINNSINTCKTYVGLDSFAVDKKLNELLKKNKLNSDILIYKPKNRNSIKFNGVPEILEKSSVINFSVSLNSTNDINAKLGLQVLNEGTWIFLPQEDISLLWNKPFERTEELSQDSKICIEYGKIDGCPVTECSNTISYRYINKVRPLEIYLGDKFQDFPTNISKNFPDEIFNCGADYEIMPETDDFYKFIIKKQKGIKSIKLKLKNICDVPALNDCPDVSLELIEDVSFDKVKYAGYTRYKINKNFFDPGEVDKLTCSDLWNYFHDINNQPLREFEVTFIPQLEENAELVNNQEETKLKLIFRTCGGH